jgi:hypothetical protein
VQPWTSRSSKQSVNATPRQVHATRRSGTVGPHLRYSRGMRGSTVLLLFLCSCSLLFEAKDSSSKADDGGTQTSDSSNEPEAFEVVCDSPDCGNQCMPGRPCILRCTSSSACMGTLSCGDASKCIIACDSSSACQDVLCTDESSCEILCTAFKSCSGDVNCRAPDCRVVCSGTESCRGGEVRCGSTANKCDITCIGDDSCGSSVECGSVDECEVRCTGERSCTQPVVCTDLCTVDCISTSCVGGVDCVNSPDCWVHCVDSSCSVTIDCPSNCLTANDGCGNCT